MNENKTAKVNILTEIPMRCYNCLNCKEHKDNEMLYDCLADNSVGVIDISDNKLFLSNMLPCDGNGWKMDVNFTMQLIKDDGIFSASKVELVNEGC